ncbi:MAG TPA: HAD-IIA family hydrolase [Candidatus Bilamarchaeaceae archaeon]|nr:HAD-IIA family hydrolase [Candidatus Bilamarchaeaceae archaeon]
MLKAIILDLDGTVYHGARVIKGVPQTIAAIRKREMKIFFLSNASMRTRSEQAEKLRKMGIKCSIKEMYNAAYATASYIKHHYPRATVYVISEGGLKKEIEAVGLKTIDNENADIVAVGLDTKLTFEKLATALRAILNGAEFIASNVDRVYPTERGWLPGSGTIAAFLEYGTKKKPIVIGKPEPHLIRAVLENEKLKKNEVLIVGDNYETDLKAAKEMKMECALVLTGLTKKKDVDKLPKTERPDFVLARLADLPANLQ